MEAWSTARIELGLTDSEWLDMTPSMVYELRKRLLKEHQRQELLIGIIASTTANFGFCRPDTPLSAEAFMVHPMKREPLLPVTGEDVRAAFAGFKKAS